MRWKCCFFLSVASIVCFVAGAFIEASDSLPSEELVQLRAAGILPNGKKCKDKTACFSQCVPAVCYAKTEYDENGNATGETICTEDPRQPHMCGDTNTAAQVGSCKPQFLSNCDTATPGPCGAYMCTDACGPKHANGVNCAQPSCSATGGVNSGCP